MTRVTGMTGITGMFGMTSMARVGIETKMIGMTQGNKGEQKVTQSITG